MTKDEVKKLRMNSPESLQFLNNATKFYNLMMMYRCAIREIQTKLEVLDDEFSVENNRNPISFIKTRIKQPNSIYDKLQKMGYEFTTENIQTYLNDVAGVRIVCAFIDDIYMISDLITQQDDIKVIEIKDYIKNPKSNGYRSYHMIVEIPVFFAKGKTPMSVQKPCRQKHLSSLYQSLPLRQNHAPTDRSPLQSPHRLSHSRSPSDHPADG